MPTTETLFESRWLGLYRIGTWDFVRRPNSDAAVGILAITPEQEIILVEQFRIPMQCHVIEIPAGLVGDEPEFAGESLAETARRELMEETGYHAGSMTKLIAGPTSSGMTSEPPTCSTPRTSSVKTAAAELRARTSSSIMSRYPDSGSGLPPRKPRAS